MTSPEGKQLFKLLDDCSRRHHQCFLAEMLLNEERTEYILCFRPTQVGKDSPNRYACQYLHLGISEANIAGQGNELGASMRALMDKELVSLGAAQ
jgi:hypothetical protein